MNAPCLRKPGKEPYRKLRGFPKQSERQARPAACFPKPIAGGAVLSGRGSMSPKTISTLAAFVMRQLGSHARNDNNATRGFKGKGAAYVMHQLREGISTSLVLRRPIQSGVCAAALHRLRVLRRPAKLENVSAAACPLECGGTDAALDCTGRSIARRSGFAK